MVGVPQLAVRYVVDGGIYVTKVVGAVPVIVVDGDDVAVPPEMVSSEPGPERPASVHDVVRTNCVPVPAVLADTVMESKV